MKQLLLITFFAMAGCLVAQNGDDPVLMTIKGNPIHKSEFEYLYNKNNTQNTLDKKSLAEYLVLFENFKMKVLEAESLGMDTTKAFLEELSGYRRQLNSVYLTDTATQNSLVKEAYDRLKEDVDVSHILIRLAPNATPDDTLAAYNKIATIRERIARAPRTITPKCGFFTKLFGKCKPTTIEPENFNEVARKESEDPSAAENSGHLGYITGFMTIYPFESVAYNTPVGQISSPIRTSYGYHIIKVDGRRPSRGKLQVAHIMKFVQKDASDSIKNKMKVVIDSLYREVKNGADFGALARKSSDDKSSAVNGGMLPWFGSGNMVKEFEDAAFQLQKGEISRPVLSPYGWHIIKLIDTKQLEPLAEKRAEIERRIQRDDRANIITLSFINKLKAQYNFKNNVAALAPFYQLAEKYSLKDSAFINATEHIEGTMATFDDQTLTQCDFAFFLNRYPNSQQIDKKALIDEKFQQFTNTALVNYKDEQLEKEYPEFGNLMREYHDGILLFNISNEKVWDKATRDTKGLETFFRTYRSNYTWADPRFKGWVISCKDEATKAKAMELIAKAPKDSLDNYLTAKLNKDTIVAKVEKGLYVKGDNNAVDKFEFKSGNFTPSKVYPVVFTYGKILKNGPESYSDVMGILTSDYQAYLEDQWMKELRRKYPVVIDQKTLKSIKEN
ncbi:peptidylprolyl isomerase [Paludibacter jiangxiensis]|uniref:Peptidyl-prolyl cis-trans isomerase SurA n=1 Tax=Paludibacter jiangxiensis TaxID=681398 RepID=A0A161LCM7_9BACT|nr:peptidylprolyl isomerase [Paludibacter jiangxiensis]GAT61605.1 peptidyl-prolyl cis-trans isomerase SurA [Paludibacter jiangxiensis]